VSAPLTLAAAQPRCVARDVAANARAHAEAIREAGCRVVVFPELSLTGYELDADAVALDDDALAPIVEACIAEDAIAFVGAPVAEASGVEHIALLRVDADGVSVAYRKTFLGGAEPERFTPGGGPVATVADGLQVGFGICKDTGVDEHVGAVAALGLDVYLAGVCHLPHELALQDERGVTIARACGAHVVLASFAGATGGGFDETAGTSTIWAPDGTVLARAGPAPGELARATIV
jgi:predicted amidohydrolase